MINVPFSPPNIQYQLLISPQWTASNTDGTESKSRPTAAFNICNMTILRGGDKRAAFNSTNLVRWNITEKLTEFIALDNQLISVVEDQGFLRHLEFLNAQCAQPSQHYITFLPLSSYNVSLCALDSWVSYSRASKQATEEMLNTCEIDKQHDVRNMKKAVDGMEAPSVSTLHFSVSHTSAGCTRGSAVTVQHLKAEYPIRT